MTQAQAGIDLAHVVGLEGVRVHDGKLTATLVLPNIPVELVDSIGRACAMAVLKAANLPDDHAAEVAQHVCADLAEWIERLTPDAIKEAEFLEANPKLPADLDDGLPF